MWRSAAGGGDVSRGREEREVASALQGQKGIGIAHGGAGHHSAVDLVGAGAGIERAVGAYGDGE